MSLYRDEREALRARLAELERDLAEARADLDREAIQKQLAALSAQVAEATAQVEDDRAALGEVAASLQKLQAAIAPAPAPAPAQGAGAPAKASADAASSPGNAVVFLIAIVGFVLLGGIFALLRSAPAPAADPNAAVAAIPGAPHAVDPIALLPVARKRAYARMSLVSIEARYVGPNGRVDLRAPSYMGSITYTFGERPPEVAPDPSAPLGAPKPSRGMPSQSEVKIDLSGIHAEPVMIGFSGQEVPDPKCTLEDVWKAAREAGAPEGAVAILSYKHDRPFAFGAKSAGTDSGAAWLFHIEGTEIHMRIEDPSCKVTTKRGLPL